MTEPQTETEHLPAPYLPKPLSDVFLTFPATVGDLMPAPEVIAEAAADTDPGWEELARDLFYGWHDNLQLLPAVFLVKSGYTSEDAWRHVRAILGSCEPKQQDKLAAVAFLLARWYRWASWSSKIHSGPVRRIEVGNPNVPAQPTEHQPENGGSQRGPSNGQEGKTVGNHADQS